jgi:hypothetical protein
MVELYPEFDWSEHPIPGRRFHFGQGWYAQADSICLYSMLRLFRPRRVVEIGSGFTSALMLDVNDRFLGGQTQLTFVDPHPNRLANYKPSSARRGTGALIAQTMLTIPTQISDHAGSCRQPASPRVFQLSRRSGVAWFAKFQVTTTFRRRPDPAIVQDGLGALPRRQLWKLKSTMVGRALCTHCCTYEAAATIG